VTFIIFDSVLDTLITSRTRLKMLLKFYTNGNSKAYLRGLAEEFGESTNSIRLELNKLSDAGYLLSSEQGRIIEYKANQDHPLYPDLRNIIHKYLGIDKIIETVVVKLGDLKYAFITGDYAQGKDSGTIELVLVGKIDKFFLKKCILKAEELVQREIRVITFVADEFDVEKYSPSTTLWLWGK
jgi:hypothetical protein